MSLKPYRTMSQNDKIEPSEVLYISETSSWGELGYHTVSSAFSSVQAVYWSPGMPKPDLSNWHGDWIFSFKADLLLAADTLARAKKGAINIHPSPPKYRGVGGYWWAIQNGDKSFGVTCHHMDERIDHGNIIRTDSFPIWAGDTVESLKHKAAIYALTLLNQTLDEVLAKKALVPCGAEWGDRLYTYKQLAIAQRTQTEQSLQALHSIYKGITGSDHEPPGAGDGPRDLRQVRK